MLDRLEFCHAVFEMTFSHRGMNVCPICEASLSHHTLCMKFGPSVYSSMYFPVGQKNVKKKKKNLKKARHCSDFEADL